MSGKNCHRLWAILAVLWLVCALPALAAQGQSTGVPGKEITPDEMRQAFPKPLEGSAPRMGFIPDAAPLFAPLPEMPPPSVQKTPEVPRPSLPTPEVAPAPAVPAPLPQQGVKAAPAQQTKIAPAPPSTTARLSTQPPERPSIEQMVGQMLMVGFTGAELGGTAPVLDLVVKGHIGGVLLLTRDARGPRNIISPAQVRVLTATLQRAARESTGRIPLFLAVEQEGGVVQALEPALGFEGNAAAARLGQGSVEATGTAGRRVGLEMAALGLNFNFAPVADVNLNPLNEEIGKKFRSFSPNPQRASAHALAFGKGLAAAGIVPCLKYFPGTGSMLRGLIDGDPLGPADMSTTWRSMELTPFREVLAQGWPGAVQPALAWHRGLDALYPATLSVRMLTDILRGQWRFGGVIVSNDLEALSRTYPLEEALLLAVQAGADVLLLPARAGVVPEALPATPGMGGSSVLSRLLSGMGGGGEGQGESNESGGLGALGGLGGLAGQSGALGALSALMGTPQVTTPERTGLVSAGALRAHDLLVQLVREGRISHERLYHSWQRIMALKKAFLYPKVSQPPVNPAP